MLNFQKGTSLVEILLVIAGIGFLIILVSTFPNTINLITLARHQSLAKEIATKEIESTREQSYINLTPGTQNITGNDTRFTLLPQGHGQKIIADCDVQICTQSELVKKVTVQINWFEEGQSKQVKLVTFISQGGLNQ